MRGIYWHENFNVKVLSDMFCLGVYILNVVHHAYLLHKSTGQVSGPASKFTEPLMGLNNV